jgi:hypothetical protein
MFGRFKKTPPSPSDMPAEPSSNLEETVDQSATEIPEAKTTYQILLRSLGDAAHEVERWPAYKRRYDFIIQR